ncbi:hypothetical protein BH11ARM2_BH11ARM2_07140 [soil metagenome]
MVTVRETTWAQLRAEAQKGQPEDSDPMVVLPKALYEEMRRTYEAARLKELLAPAVKQMNEGECIPWAEVESELREKYFLPD